MKKKISLIGNDIGTLVFISLNKVKYHINYVIMIKHIVWVFTILLIILELYPDVVHIVSTPKVDKPPGTPNWRGTSDFFHSCTSVYVSIDSI